MLLVFLNVPYTNVAKIGAMDGVSRPEMSGFHGKKVTFGREIHVKHSVFHAKKGDFLLKTGPIQGVFPVFSASFDENDRF